MVSKDYAMGFVVGLVMVIAIMFILWKFNKKSLKGNFDERQELVRGKGYRYSTFTLLVLIALDMAADSIGVYEIIPVTHSVVLFGIILAGVLVYAMYCIKNDAYFGVGQDTRGYRIMMWSVIGLNAFTGIRGLREGIMEDGKLASRPCISLILSIAFLAVLITLYVRNAGEKKTDADEDAIGETTGDQM